MQYGSNGCENRVYVCKSKTNCELNTRNNSYDSLSELSVDSKSYSHDSLDEVYRRELQKETSTKNEITITMTLKKKNEIKSINRREREKMIISGSPQITDVMKLCDYIQSYNCITDSKNND
jgi:hypothetical protein